MTNLFKKAILAIVLLSAVILLSSCAKTYTNRDTVGEIFFFTGEHGDQVGTTNTLTVNGERGRAGRAAGLWLIFLLAAR